MITDVHYISDRIAVQSDKIAAVADQLWKSNRDCGSVNSVVAGWAVEQLLDVVSSLNALGGCMASDVSDEDS